jgi:hypothetical protein
MGRLFRRFLRPGILLLARLDLATVLVEVSHLWRHLIVHARGNLLQCGIARVLRCFLLSALLGRIVCHWFALV